MVTWPKVYFCPLFFFLTKRALEKLGNKANSEHFYKILFIENKKFKMTFLMNF